MNALAWEVAADSMVRKGNKVSAYSTTQLRKFFTLAQSRESDVFSKIEQMARQYHPQPARPRAGLPGPGEQRDLEERQRKNKLICDKVSKAFARMSPEMRTGFVRYMMWNTKIIEQLFSVHSGNPVLSLENVLKAEGIENRNTILQLLKPLVTNQGGYQSGGPGTSSSHNERRMRR